MPSAFTAPMRGTVLKSVARALTRFSGAGSSKKASWVAMTSEVIVVAVTAGRSLSVPTVRSPSSSATIASVSPSAAGLWLRPVKVATPATAATSTSPPIAPALDSVRVMVSVKSASTLPKASTAATTGWVVKAAPAVVPAGMVVKRRLVATIWIGVVPVTAVLLPTTVPTKVRSLLPVIDRVKVRPSVSALLSL